ncbi:hypothetical protein DESPIG_02344 [Desulfovibrio piger ATCC 29098]|uniref:Uncharacterized protein n=1 Tax=Desulfovibrio piger ATCC 29098 TaxID=411464 RepID=B6WW77_9BACT|nr:hypothetical protein DESPIG_02344 [Desulfovibrio piger ATCC 29098]
MSYAPHCLPGKKYKIIAEDVDARHLPVFALPAGYPREKNFFHD